MSSERDRERRIPDDGERRRDYPEVQFTLVGDEGKSPVELEKEIKAIIAKRDAIILEMECLPPDEDHKYCQKSDSAD